MATKRVDLDSLGLWKAILEVIASSVDSTSRGPIEIGVDEIQKKLERTEKITATPEEIRDAVISHSVPELRIHFPYIGAGRLVPVLSRVTLVFPSIRPASMD